MRSTIKTPGGAAVVQIEGQRVRLDLESRFDPAGSVALHLSPPLAALLAAELQRVAEAAAGQGAAA